MQPTNFSELILIFTDLILLILPVFIGLSILAFIFGIAKFIFKVGGDEKSVEEGKNLIIWGLVALFVLVSLMGLIRFFSGELGFGPVGVPFLPIR